ncbi:hypothetical protein [Brevundimonas nasdae]|uniref:hypothetical protein n=1 Tax=Brevundimonas nasdae TaxID=172043 RepID=UPI003F68D6DE
MTRIEDVSAHYVAEKRRLNASWAAIARMTGCSETALRQRFAPSGDLRPAVGEARLMSPRLKAEKAMRAAGVSQASAVILARLWHANGARVTGVELTRGLDGVATVGEQVGAARVEGRRLLQLEYPTGAYALTADSVTRISHLIQDWERRA